MEKVEMEMEWEERESGRKGARLRLLPSPLLPHSPIGIRRLIRACAGVGPAEAHAGRPPELMVERRRVHWVRVG